MIRGRYYLYNIKSVRDPVTKKVKKVTLGQVGTITQEYGLIPTGMVRKGKIPEGESPFKIPPKEQADFLDRFEKITDPRSLKNQLYTIAITQWMLWKTS